MLKIAKPKNDREKNMESFLPTSEIAKNRREIGLLNSGITDQSIWFIKSSKYLNSECLLK